MKFRIREIAFALFVMVMAYCLTVLRSDFSYATGIDYEALVELSEIALERMVCVRL